MTKQVLDIELAGIDPNRPGSKGVTEAVGVNLAHPSPQAVTGEHHVHVMIAKRSAVKGLEEAACAPAPKVLQVGSKGSEGYLAYRRPALLTSGLQAASKVVTSSFANGWTTFCSRLTIGTRMNGFSST